MTLTIPRSAAGLALLGVLAAGCGAAVGGHHGAAAPAARHTATHAPAPPAHHSPAHHGPAHHTPAANPIPQGNGGDHDPDNNGGPSDGDGNI